MRSVGVNKSFWKAKKVFITGGTGFIGANLTKKLVNLKADVTLIDRDIKNRNPLKIFKIEDKVNKVLGDVRNSDLVDRIINDYGIEVVFHLSAQPIVGVANRSPVSTFESNIRGTWTILESCRRYKDIVKSIVVASSDKAYGDQKNIPYKEDYPLLGIYPYDASKVCADIIARSYATTFDLPIAVTRLANTYGECDFHLNRIVPGTIISLLRNEVPVIRSDGSLERDYLYVEDAVKGYLLLAESVYQGQNWGEAFNFGTGKLTSVIGLFDLIIKISGKKVKPQILGEAYHEIKNQSLDSTKANVKLKWQPRVTIGKGLKNTFDWYKSHSRIVT